MSSRPYLAVNSSKLSSWWGSCASWSASFLVAVEKAEAVVGLSRAGWKLRIGRTRQAGVERRDARTTRARTAEDMLSVGWGWSGEGWWWLWWWCVLLVVTVERCRRSRSFPFRSFVLAALPPEVYGKQDLRTSRRSSLVEHNEHGFRGGLLLAILLLILSYCHQCHRCGNCCAREAMGARKILSSASCNLPRPIRMLPMAGWHQSARHLVGA